MSEHSKSWHTILRWGLGLSAALLALRFLWKPLLPFLFGLAVAALAERPVHILTERGMRRGLAAGLCVGAILSLSTALLWLLIQRGFFELQALCRELPSLLAALSEPMQRLQGWLEGLAERAPDGLGNTLRDYVDALFSAGPSMAGRLSESALSHASDFAAALPGILLAAVTALLSSFLISAEWPELRRMIGRCIPQSWRRSVLAAAARVREALGSWLRAQLKLMGITFGIVTVGLLLIGIDYALLLGGLIALVDALPVFGTGTVLLPWALLFFLRGNPRCGFAMIAVYAVAALSRTALEPRLVGKQMGLPPLLALLAMYLGFRFLGLSGMILFPVGAMVAMQFSPIASDEKL